VKSGFALVSQRVESLKARFTNQKSWRLFVKVITYCFSVHSCANLRYWNPRDSAQMAYFKNTDLGFSKVDPIITNNLNSIDKTEVFRQKLLSHPAIKDVSFSSSSPMTEDNHHFGTSFRLPGTREEDGMGAEEKGVDMNYLSFYGLEVLAGRNFSSMEQNFTEFIVNEKVVKALGWTPQEAIGKRLVINEGEATIVGVIKDFHNNSLQNEISLVYF
jgi:putative ABC transport system permease protein